MNKILIVDDMQSNIDILRSVLSKAYQISVAKNGEKAIDVAKKIMPDLILLDIMMPVMSGYDVIRILKDDEKLKEIPVIFITAQSELHEKTLGFELGAVDYVVKPFEALEVKARVETHIKLVQSKKEIQELLSKTLVGAVGMFMELEKNIHPEVFCLSYKVKDKSVKIAKLLNLQEIWMVELGSLLSQIGLLYMNPISAQNIINGRFAGSADQNIYKKYPYYGSELIKKIPRLESISEMIQLLSDDLGMLPFDEKNIVYSGAQIIKVVIEYEMSIGKGLDANYILKKMLASSKQYSKEVVFAIAKIDNVTM